jgi:hypothetical protein
MATSRGFLSRTRAPCSGPRRCGGTRLFSSSMGLASRTSSGRPRCTDGSNPKSASPSSMPSPSGFENAWMTGRRAALSLGGRATLTPSDAMKERLAALA